MPLAPACSFLVLRNTKIGCLLDEDLVSASARRELEAVRYGITMARRN